MGCRGVEEIVRTNGKVADTPREGTPASGRLARQRVPKMPRLERKAEAREQLRSRTRVRRRVDPPVVAVAGRPKRPGRRQKVGTFQAIYAEYAFP